MRRALLGLGLIATIGASVLAQRAPDFSGTWVMQPTSRPAGGMGGGGATATASGGGQRMGQASGAASSGAAASGGARMGGGGGTMGMSGGGPPEITVAQTVEALTIDRRVGEATQRSVYRLDGSESVNTNGNVTTRSRSRWDGATLVTEGTQTVKTTQGEVSGSFKEVRSVDATGQLVVDITRQTPSGQSVTSKQTYKKK